MASRKDSRSRRIVQREKRSPNQQAIPRKRRQSGTHIEIPCIPHQQADIQMYVFTMSAKDLWDLVDVNRRSEDKEEGYQRAFSASRVRKISKYIDQHYAIPGAVLVSFDDGDILDDGRRLRIPNVPHAGWVIDGQHRLIGAAQADSEFEFAVIAFIKLPLEQQIEFFITINREQKGVASSLYYDLLKHLPRMKSEKEVLEERANDLVNMLKRDQDSPFFQRIVATTSPRKGQISSTNFVRKVVPHIRSNGRLFDYTDEERAGILNAYYKALKKVFPDEYHSLDSVFFKTIGFGAMLNVLPTVLEITFRVAGKSSFRVQHVSTALKLIDDFDFDAWRQMGTGVAAENQASSDLRTRLNDSAQNELGGLIELD
ncbi:MAG: DGQHR domain-containing protein [Phycisphaerales bacterium]